MFKRFMLISLVLSLIVLTFTSCKKDDPKNSATNTKSPVSSAKTATPSLTNTATATATTTASPTATVSTAVTDYSIEVDFQIVSDEAGVVFGYQDEGNFLMWQVLAPTAEEGKVVLRPHIWVEGTVTVIDEIDITNTFTWADRIKKQHIKINVNATNEITTYINGILVHTYTEPAAQYAQFGFREYTTSDCYFDNLVIKNNVGGKILAQFDFNSDTNPLDQGELVSGVMGDSQALHVAALLPPNCTVVFPL